MDLRNNFSTGAAGQTHALFHNALAVPHNIAVDQHNDIYEELKHREKAVFPDIRQISLASGAMHCLQLFISDTEDVADQLEPNSETFKKFMDGLPPGDLQHQSLSLVRELVQDLREDFDEMDFPAIVAQEQIEAPIIELESYIQGFEQTLEWLEDRARWNDWDRAMPPLHPTATPGMQAPILN